MFISRRCDGIGVEEKDIYCIAAVADVVVACHCRFSLCGSSEITGEVVDISGLLFFSFSLFLFPHRYLAFARSVGRSFLRLLPPSSSSTAGNKLASMMRKEERRRRRRREREKKKMTMQSREETPISCCVFFHMSKNDSHARPVHNTIHTISCSTSRKSGPVFREQVDACSSRELVRWLLLFTSRSQVLDDIDT